MTTKKNINKYLISVSDEDLYMDGDTAHFNTGRGLIELENIPTTTPKIPKKMVKKKKKKTKDVWQSPKAHYRGLDQIW